MLTLLLLHERNERCLVFILVKKCNELFIICKSDDHDVCIFFAIYCTFMKGEKKVRKYKMLLLKTEIKGKEFSNITYMSIYERKKNRQ